MIDLKKIFTDENPPSIQIDFSNALWATNELQEIFRRAKPSLNDVDFVVETDTEFIFVECKNSNRVDAKNPDAFNPLENKLIDNIARKYFDSLMFYHFLNKTKNKRKIFCYILESKLGSLTMRNQAKNILVDKLPFKLQKQNNFPNKMIDEFQVLSFDEWNLKFPQFPLKRLISPICQN